MTFASRSIEKCWILSLQFGPPTSYHFLQSLTLPLAISVTTTLAANILSMHCLSPCLPVCSHHPQPTPYMLIIVFTYFYFKLRKMGTFVVICILLPTLLYFNTSPQLQLRKLEKGSNVLSRSLACSRCPHSPVPQPHSPRPCCCLDLDLKSKTFFSNPH